MNFHYKFLFHILLLFALTLQGCVSVQLSGKKAKKSSVVTFEEPQTPFEKIDNEQVDVAWQNRKNGNTIAFLSECDVNTETSIGSMQTESLSVLTNESNKKSETIEYNGREALASEAVGFVDGIKVKVKLLIFKKNNCNYTLTFLGREKVFESDKVQYEKFIERFKVQ